MKNIVYVFRTKIIDYQTGLSLQKYFSSIFNSTVEKENFKNVLILTEHQPVYTLGIRTKDYSINDEEKLKNTGAQFYKTDRGGLITFHGPGQLVAYPILHLKQFKPSVRWYVNNLEESVIQTCKKFEIKAQRTEHTGIWVNDKKICAIGIHASRYITTHGIGFNCNTDLKWFDHITPCGIDGKGVTSISNELKRNITIDEAIPAFLKSFSEVFDCIIDDVNIKTLNEFDKLKENVMV